MVGILDVAEKEDLMITCKSGVTIRMPVEGISEQGRATQGVKLIRLDNGDEIAAITRLDDENGNNNGTPATGSEPGTEPEGTATDAGPEATNPEDTASEEGTDS